MTEYEVTLTERAEADVERIYLWHSRRSPEIADRWYAGLLAALPSLSTMPGRCAVAPEDAVFPDVTVRQLIYGKGRNRYRILFFVIEPREGEERGVVRILRVLHGAQRRLGPMSQDGDDGAE